MHTITITTIGLHLKKYSTTGTVNLISLYILKYLRKTDVNENETVIHVSSWDTAL